MNKQQANEHIAALVAEIAAKVAEITNLATEHDLQVMIPFGERGGARLATEYDYEEWYDSDADEWFESEKERKEWKPAGGWYSSSYEC